eukprot:854465-Prymnesium_polylepis.2
MASEAGIPGQSAASVQTADVRTPARRYLAAQAHAEARVREEVAELLDRQRREDGRQANVGHVEPPLRQVAQAAAAAALDELAHVGRDGLEQQRLRVGRGRRVSAAAAVHLFARLASCPAG